MHEDEDWADLAVFSARPGPAEWVAHAGQDRQPWSGPLTLHRGVADLAVPVTNGGLFSTVPDRRSWRYRDGHDDTCAGAAAFPEIVLVGPGSMAHLVCACPGYSALGEQLSIVADYDHGLSAAGLELASRARRDGGLEGTVFDGWAAAAAAHAQIDLSPQLLELLSACVNPAWSHGPLAGWLRAAQAAVR